MSDAGTAQTAIDWDDIQTKLKDAFDAMARCAAAQTYDSNRQSYSESMARIAEALARTSAEARAQREAANKDNFKIEKGT